MADHNTKKTNLSSKPGPSPATSRAGRCCKRKIDYAQDDDLLSIIFGEGEHQSECQEDLSGRVGPAIPKKIAKQGKGTTIPPSKKRTEKATK